MKNKYLPLTVLALITLALLASCSQPVNQFTTPAAISTASPATNPVASQVTDPATELTTSPSPSITNSVKSGPSGSAEFNLSISLPEAKGKVKIYQLIKPVVTADSVAALGAKLGFTGQTGAFDGAIGMSSPDEKSVLKKNVKSGMIEYSLLSEVMPKTPPVLPSNEQAAVAAADFLKKSGLWSSDISVKEVVVGATHNGKPMQLLVRFSRTIDGLPMTGTGDKFGVRIGDQGKVVNCLIYYPEPGAFRQVQSLEPTLAFDKLKARQGNVSVPAKCQTVNIKEVFLGYSADSIEDPMYLIPVYAFKGECLDKDGKYIQDFSGWVDATAP